MTPYEMFIYKRTYARYLSDENRREEWGESVGRYFDFFTPRVPEKYRNKLDSG